jgi:hypothetical protein
MLLQLLTIQCKKRFLWRPMRTVICLRLSRRPEDIGLDLANGGADVSYVESFAISCEEHVYIQLASYALCSASSILRDKRTKADNGQRSGRTAESIIVSHPGDCASIVSRGEGY